MKIKTGKELIEYFRVRHYPVCLNFMQDKSPNRYIVNEYMCSIFFDRICQKTRRIDFLDFTPYKKNKQINYNKIKKLLKE